jgi:cytochrome c biogenesis protein CcdA
MLAALAVVGSLLLIAISFIFDDNFPLHAQYVPYVKGIILAFFLAVLLFFYQAFRRIEKIFKACDKVSEEIERRLTVDKRTRGTSDFEGLLVGLELRRTEDGKWYTKNRFKVYIGVGLVALIALVLLLFVFINV